MVVSRIDTKGLDSKGVGAIAEHTKGEWHVYIRQDYVPQSMSYTFVKVRKAFTTERDALIYFAQTYPQGRLVAFDTLTLA